MDATTRANLQSEARDYRERAGKLLQMADSIEALLKRDLELNPPASLSPLLFDAQSVARASASSPRLLSRMTQADAMIEAIKHRGEPLTTEQIFQTIQGLRLSVRLPSEHKFMGAVLSRNKDIFEHIGKGLWKLRENFQSVNGQKESGAA